MGIHGDDVTRVIRQALSESDTCNTQSQIFYTLPGITGWPVRDGRQHFYAMGRDWFRAFKITVEVVDESEWEGDFHTLTVSDIISVPLDRRTPTHRLLPDGSLEKL
jgi:hypothetical protein